MKVVLEKHRVFQKPAEERDRLKTIAEMVEAARKSGRKRVAVAAAQEASALEAVVDAWANGLAEPILIGDLPAIEALGAKLGLDLTRFERIQAKDSAAAAAEAVRLVRMGDADVLMKGLLDSSVLLKAVFNKETGINSGSLASHVAVIEAAGYHKLLFVSDAAINIAPDVPAKVHIIANAVRASRALGLVLPKVALLAAVEKVNYEKMPCTVDAAVLAQMGRRGQLGACLVDGPLAFDIAISRESADLKNIDSEVGGDADILVVPSIEAGNILYKCLIDLCGAKGAGIVMGAAAPIVLTSRSDSAETMLASIAFAALASR
jgi:phosphate butyryltransferase